MYSAKSIANYFLNIKDNQLNHRKLQKLIYFTHGWYLAIKKEPLLNEQVETWRCGPIIPSIYREFIILQYGNEEDILEEKALSFDTNLRCCYTVPVPNDIFVKELIRKVWEVYGKFTGIQLVNMTYLKGSPWYEIHNKPFTRIGTDIPDDLIEKWFVTIALKNMEKQNNQ